jgi:KRAB domain-containing zinc finger protein
MKKTNQEEPFKCTKCRKHYWTKSSFKAHMNSYHDEAKRHQCYFCSYATDQKSNIIGHISKHTKEKPYRCEYCFQWFRSEQSVKRHRDGNCNSCNPKLTFPLCYFCDKVLSKNRRLNEHMKMVHLKENFKLCKLCCKYFSSTSAVNHHIRSVHLLQRNYKCQLCSKKFGSISDLNHHIQSAHTKERPFKCYFCSKSFVTLEGLKKHMLIHTREKSLTCYFCRKEFSDEQDLSAHIRRFHTKETPFQCRKCPSNYFSTKATLTRHTRIQHGIRVHQ